MATYRRYFFRDGHIKAVEELRCPSDDDARRHARRLLAQHPGFELIEVWDRARKVETLGTPTAA